MAFSKIILNGTTLMDLTADTVDSSTAVQGETGHNAAGESFVGNYQGSTINNQNKSVSPTESQQQVTADSGYTGLGTVTVGAISSTYVGSGIATHTSGDLTVSGATITAPAGYYGASASKSVATMTLPTSTAANASSGYTSKATVSRSTSDQYINIPTGYNASGAYYKINAVANGTEGTPTATKGTVSNHSVSITPSVTNTAGYISGGTKNGTAVTVTASELASGNKEITQNGTGIDVVGYSTVSVSVSGGGGSSVQEEQIDSELNSKSASLSFENLKGEPTSFIIMYDDGMSTPSGTPFNALAVVYDGVSVHAQTLTNTSNAQVTYDGSSFSKSYSNGTLTVTSTGAQFPAGFWVMSYTYGGSAANVHTADVQVGSGATSITFTGLEDEPLCWSCIFKSNFGTSSGYQRVIAIRKREDSGSGINIYGFAMDSSAHGSATLWTESYSNGSLTITSNGTNSGGYFHQPGYYQLTYIIGEASPYQKKTVTPTSSQQTVTPDSGYDALSQVTVNAIPSSYVQPTSTVGATTYRAATTSQTINAGTYHSAAATIAAVSQTNLSAENIKSGTTISISNGQSNLWSVTGTYSGGSTAMNTQTVQSTSRRSNTALGSITSLTCKTAGTYTIYWTCTRSNTSQTWGSQIYIGGTAYGTENTTWSNNVQNNELTGVTLTANATVAVYGRSRSGYYIYAPQLTIVQTA